MLSKSVCDLAEHDGVLLRRFWQERSDVAFMELVRRHSEMVLTACRSTLGPSADAEDAAQAVFLTLMRKAPSLLNHPSLAGWLHLVALHICRDLQRARAIRMRHERKAVQMKPTLLCAASHTQAEALHAALATLPELYRVPLILHHLEQRSQEEVAALLGCKVGTVSGRLVRGRNLLRQKLARKGLVLSATAVMTVLADQSLATVSTGFLASMSQMAASAATGSASMIASATVQALSAGALQIWSGVKAKVAVTMAALLLIGGASTVACLVLQARHWQDSAALTRINASQPILRPQPVGATTTRPTCKVLQIDVIFDVRAWFARVTWRWQGR